MEYYAIFRRHAFDPDEIGEADGRSNAELQRAPERVRKIRSYLLQEADGSMGTLCLYQAESPEAIHEHGRAANLPVDEVVPISTIDVHRPDPDLSPSASG